MFRKAMIAALALIGLDAASLHAAETTPFHVGEVQRLIHPARPRNWRGAQTQGLITRIWYPVDAAAPQTPHDIGDPAHPLFKGHPIAVGAPLSAARSRYPLLLLSHGAGGSADSLDWLASALAEAGYVVVGVNHPGNTALEPLTLAGFRLWWERATDLTDALDAVLADPQFGARIDRARIGAVGFSLGGYTVLELAGARTVPDAFGAFCASPAADAICHPPEMDRIGPAAAQPGQPPAEIQASLAHAGDSYRDGRVRAVFAIAPALGEAFGPGSFADVKVPVSLSAGSADAIAPVATNIRRFGSFMPAADVALTPGAGHYTFLDSCLPSMTDAVALLCKDGPGVDREAVHRWAIDRAVSFFARTLK